MVLISEIFIRCPDRISPSWQKSRQKPGNHRWG